MVFLSPSQQTWQCNTVSHDHFHVSLNHSSLIISATRSELCTAAETEIYTNKYITLSTVGTVFMPSVAICDTELRTATWYAAVLSNDVLYPELLSAGLWP